ncbi:MAG: L,D-transpeptidase family protein [Bacteroidetes bacterium]|nr:L,D-transpeptidase family protein [Bacteroidota bacterium]
MRKSFHTSIAVLIFISLLACGSCKFIENRRQGTARDPLLNSTVNLHGNKPFDSNLVGTFYHSYPALEKYRENVVLVYRQQQYKHIWLDDHGVVELGQTLYTKVRDMGSEGLPSKFPYQEKIDGVFANDRDNTLSPAETEIMLTNLYLYYAEKVYKGIADSTTTAIGWLLPRKQVSYETLLDSLVADPGLLNRNDSVLFGQYYKLRDVLQRYREIEKKGGWKPVDLDPKLKSYKPGDTARTIIQIRERLFVTGDLKQNSGSNQFDDELAEAMNRYQLRNGFNPGKLILPKHIKQMNVPISELIKKIIVNMERCRWISPEIVKAKEYIVVNIPAFKLNLVRNGKIEFSSAVIVGTNVTKTVIFSGMMSNIVFSPYWNLPVSIINKEVKPGMAKHKNYLETHNMEWNNGQVRQKPGKNNSLGLVKFIFPNADDIYMHDTPAKSLFSNERRAFSHGCIRLAKPRDMAVEILKDDPNWTPGKIDAAMHAGIERSYPLKAKIPVYIGYFTAWVNQQGEINFYEDIYERDGSLTELLMAEK